ncbi:MAG: xanthine dehydrogenase family protein molybdopterin-binding subunit [Bacteroidota bacterium]
MSDQGRHTRREFIKVVSASGAGLFLGSYFPAYEPPPESPQSNIFAPSVFIKVEPSGLVTIVVPRSEMGQGVFTSLAMLVAEELEVDWKTIKVEHAYGDKRFGDQTTGGSTSIRKKWEPLRIAGATARTMLIGAAAARWKVKPSDCAAKLGFVVNTKNGATLSYGDLAEEASKIPVPEDVPLKDPKDYSVIGKSVHRLDTPGKVYGETQFGIDHTLPGMLYATVLHCPTFGGKIKRYDAANVKAVRGVLDVFSISSGIAVVAESTWLAFKGQSLLSAEWDSGPNATLNSETIRSMMAEKLRERGEVLTQIGNPITPTGQDAVIEAVYETPYLAHATMEPMNCVASFKDGKVEVWAPTQSPQDARTEVAKALGLGEESVTVYVTFMGGGFGRRVDPDFAVEAAEISQHTAKPVKVTWTREEDMKHDFYRPPSMHQLKGTIDGNGRPSSLQHHVITPSIEEQRSRRPLDPRSYDFKGGAIEREYRIPFMQLTGSIVSIPIPIGYWRAVYRSQNPFALESFIDEMAVAARKDPFDFRVDMLPEGSRLRNVLTVAAQKSDWYKKLGKGRGKGIAAGSAYDSYCAYVAEVTVDQDSKLRVDRFVCAVDCGLVVNPDTVEAQMQSCVAFALSAAIKGRITIANGGVVEANFDSYPILTYDEMPKVEVHIVPSAFPVGGIGELGMGACAPALCNAIFSATGKRVRNLPIDLA